MEGSTVVTVVELGEKLAIVLLPDGSQEQWSTANLPEGTQEGSKIRYTVKAGDLEMELLPSNRPRA